MLFLLPTFSFTFLGGFCFLAASLPSHYCSAAFFCGHCRRFLLPSLYTVFFCSLLGAPPPTIYLVPAWRVTSITLCFTRFRQHCMIPAIRNPRMDGEQTLKRLLNKKTQEVRAKQRRPARKQCSCKHRHVFRPPYKQGIQDEPTSTSKKAA